MARKKKVDEQLHLEGTNPSVSEREISEVEQVQTEPVIKVDENQTTINDFVGDSILEQHVVEGLIKEAEESEKKTTKKKTAISSIIFLTINILFMIFIVRNLLNSANVANFGVVAEVQQTRLWWLAVGFGLLILFFACETFLFYFLIKKNTGKRRFWLSYRLAAVGKYYDCITPTQVGGQPSQIFRLTKSGLSAGQATSIPIIKLIVYSFVYTAISFFLYFYGLPMITTAGSLQGFLMALVKILGGIGLVVTVIMTFLYFIIGNGKLIGRSFVQWLVRVGYKLHIVKDYRKALSKMMTQVQEYQSSIRYLNKHKGTLIISVGLCLLECAAYALIPFTVVMAFGSVTFASVSDALFCVLVTMSSYYLCLLVSTIIPLPGGTGTMEICFIFLFSIGTFSVGDNIGWALIFFRLISYYAVIVHGFLHIVVENIARLIKNKKQNKEIKQ